MKKKVTTPQCVKFLVNHYIQNKKIITKEADWEKIRKYKNLENQTCRDFYHEELGLEAIVVIKEKPVEKQVQSALDEFTNTIEEDDFELHVIENASFIIFVREKKNKATYYFAPFVSNNGFIIYVEDARRYDQYRRFEKTPKGQKPYVLKSLQGIFKNKEIVSMREDNMFISFPSMNIDEVCKRLMKKHWRFCPDFFEQIQSAGYIPYHPEVEFIKYEFPDYKLLTTKQKVDKLYELVANEKGDWKKSNYAKVQYLIEKMPLEEIQKIEDTLLDIRGNKDKKLKRLIEKDINKKRSDKIVKRIAHDGIFQIKSKSIKKNETPNKSIEGMNSLYEE